MAIKHIPTNGQGDATQQYKAKSKKKPDAWKESQASRLCRLNRERLFWKIYPEQRAEIEERVKEWQLEWKKQDERL